MTKDEKKEETGGEESAEEDKAETSGDADSAGDDAPEEEEEEEAPKKRKRGPPKGSKRGSGKKKAAKRNQPKTMDMIIEAIENLGERKGSSYQAIKAYILQNFRTVRADMIRSMMRRALSKGLEQSVFMRPKGQANNKSISGRYLLGKSARKEEEEEVMPQMSKRAQAVAALKAKKGKKKGRGRKRGKAKKPVAKNAKGRK